MQERLDTLLSINGTRTADSFHRELGTLHVGLLRHVAQRGRPAKALDRIPELREEFWRSVKVPGTGYALNQQLEKANRVADFLEFGELMALDALCREESCGGHFREEHQTADGEAERDDEHFAHVAAWEYAGPDQAPVAPQGSARVRLRPPDATSYA